MKSRRESLSRTEGERLLRERVRRKSLATIAREIGNNTSQDIISKWLHGSRRPNPSSRASIYAAYDIPIDAWDIVPKLDGERLEQPAALPPPPEPSALEGNGHRAGPPPSTLDDCLAMLARIRVQRDKPDLTPGEQMKLADTETRLLTLRARLERDAERSEDRIVREHPAWRKLMRLIRKTLAKHPGVLKELAVALHEDLEAEGADA